MSNVLWLSVVVYCRHVFFFYRPKSFMGSVSSEVRTSDDIAQFYILLQPYEGTREKQQCRLIVMNDNSLPNIDFHQRQGAYVEIVDHNIDHILRHLGKLSGDSLEIQQQFWQGTDTLRPPACPCGEGIYEFVQHGLDDPRVHFVYMLEVPVDPGGCLNIVSCH